MTTDGDLFNSAFARLEEWYASMCNDSWEHQYGVRITNIDNPGWSLEVDIADSYLSSYEFSPVERQGREDDDWLFCSVKEQVFVGCCGPRNMRELVCIFLDWAGQDALPGAS